MTSIGSNCGGFDCVWQKSIDLTVRTYELATLPCRGTAGELQMGNCGGTAGELRG